MFKHVLLANDGSDASLHAARLALDLAQVHGARLSVLNVVDPYPFLGIGEVNPLGFEAYMGAARRSALEAHEQVMALAQSLPLSAPVDTVTIEDVAAAEGIVKTAEELACDLIVIGSHGRGAVARLVMGSVAHKVLNLSKIPVLVSR